MALAAALAVTGCTPDAERGAGQGGAASDSGTSPLSNPEGTRAGLAPITTGADRASARQLIGKVSTKGRGPKTGYARDEFGYAWMDTAEGVPLARNGCDTRIISMLRIVMGLFSQRMQGVVGCA